MQMMVLLVLSDCCQSSLVWLDGPVMGAGEELACWTCARACGAVLLETAPPVRWDPKTLQPVTEAYSAPQPVVASRA